MTAREVALRAAGRIEQEIRAYPRVYRAFYRVLNGSPRVRALVGRAKAGVRGAGAVPHTPVVVEPAALRAVREAAVSERLGLHP